MEQLLVFEVHEAPDATLADVDRWLTGQRFRTRPGEVYDLVASRGLGRVFVGIGPHRLGLAARVKTKALVPGRAQRLFEDVERVLVGRLGAPVRGTDHPPEARL